MSLRAGYLLVFAAAILFGINQPLSRVLIDGPLPARYLAASRLLGLVVVFGGWALLRYRDAIPRGRELAALVVYGLVGIAALQWALTEAIARIDVGLVLSFAYSASIETALWCLVVRRERQPALLWVAMVVAIGGILLALGVGGSTFDELSGAGIAFAFAASLGFSYYALHGERLLARSPAPVVLGVAATVAAVAWTSTAAPIWEYPTGALTDDVSLGGNLDLALPGALVVGWTVLIGTALPYALYLVGIGIVGPTRGVLTGSIEPVVAVVAAWAWIDQRLTLLQVVGCALVLGAVLAIQLARARVALVE